MIIIIRIIIIINNNNNNNNKKYNNHHKNNDSNENKNQKYITYIKRKYQYRTINALIKNEEKAKKVLIKTVDVNQRKKS